MSSKPNSACEGDANKNTKTTCEMAEFISDVPEEKEAAAKNATPPTCDKRHCREMRKEKLPPYLRDRGNKISQKQEKSTAKIA